MPEFIIEAVRAFFISLIFIFLSIQGRRKSLRLQSGWLFIQIGFGLILLGSLIDISDNFSELNRFIIIGDTLYEAFLEKIVGYTTGFLLLAIGFWKWLPTVIKLHDMQTALRESEEKCRSLFENASVGIFVHDSETGQVLLANRKALERNAVSSLEELCAKDRWLPEPYSRGDVQRWIRKAATEGPQQFEWKDIDVRGDIFWCDISLMGLVLGGVPRVVAFAQDITTRKKTEQALRESEATYRGIIDSFSEAVYILDEQGRFIDVNKGAERMYGYTRQEMLGMSPADLSAPGKNDLALVMEKCRLAFSGEPQEIEFWGLAKDGRIFPKEVHAYPGEYFGKKVIVAIARDITERKRAEEALRESEELYRLLTELSPNSVTVADTAGIIRMVNPKALELFRHAHESEAIGRTVFEWVSAESKATASAAFQELLRKGSVTGLELKLQRRDGAEFMGEVNGSVLNDLQGYPKLVIIVTSDITERKQAEEERLKLQKLEAVGTLAGGIAHDFNNLLQGVFGYISMARLKMNDKEKAQAMLDQAEKALSMSVNLTTQLLTFAKGGKPVRKNLVLKPIIENAAKFALSGSKCSCRMKLSEDLWLADADEGQIGQVLQNIVINAREAMPEGGTIEVSAGNKEITDSKYGLLPAGGRFVMISVRDSGIGISEQYLPKIFDPYFTTKQRGSGLGLATSYSIVRNHGGMIDVMSEAGKGTTFCIYLPTAEPEEVEQPSLLVPVSRKGKILVMDDEEMVRSIAGEMIEAIGHDVEYARDGEEAIEKFRVAREAKTPFDVVILDLTIKGGMGGEEAIKQLRKIDPNVVALVSSGYADNPVIADFQSYGFSAFLNKPYRIEALRDCLNVLLEGG